MTGAGPNFASNHLGRARQCYAPWLSSVPAPGAAGCSARCWRLAVCSAVHSAWGPASEERLLCGPGVAGRYGSGVIRTGTSGDGSL